MRKNCWEFNKCGREMGGKNEHILGPCIAATNTSLDGVHCGKNGGRACWVIAGTLCGGKIQGTLAHKLDNCKKCNFYKMVKYKEGNSFEELVTLYDKLK